MSDRENLGARVERALSDEAVWVELPHEVESNLMAAIVTDGIRPERRLARSLSRWRAVAIAAGVAVIALGFALLTSSDEPPLEGTVFAVTGSAAAPQISGTATVGRAEAGWWLRLELSGLGPAPDGSYYEGWVTDGIDVISIGTFHMRDGDYVALWSGVPVTEYPELSVTIQEIGGDHGPSGDLVLTGRLNAG